MEVVESSLRYPRAGAAEVVRMAGSNERGDRHHQTPKRHKPSWETSHKVKDFRSLPRMKEVPFDHNMIDGRLRKQPR
jgi:hypothetical protein